MQESRRGPMLPMLSPSSGKLQKFKEAVEGTKRGHEEEHDLRRARTEQLRGALDAIDTPDTVSRNFSAQERLGLMAKCKMWNTDRFEPVRVLGEGAFGVVHLVREIDTGEYRALKQMDKDRCIKKNSRDAAYAELDILAKNRSRWFVELYATFQDAENIYTVMEFLQGGDLVGRLIAEGRLSEDETRFYMAELLEALDTVHSAGYVHRDVKPENMVFSSSGHLKLLDFGLARFCPLACAQARCKPIAAGNVHVKLFLPELAITSPRVTHVRAFDLDPSKVVLAEIKVAVTRIYEDFAASSVAAKSVRVYLRRKSGDLTELQDDGRTLASLGLSGPGPHELVVCPSVSATRRREGLQGTPQYMPPEVWRGADHGPEGDLWALGVITFECLVGHVPFDAADAEGDDMVRAVRDMITSHKELLAAEFQRARGQGYVSDAGEGFLRGVLSDQAHRYGAEQCRRSSFFAGIDFGTLHEADPPFVPDVSGPDDTRFFEEARSRTLPPTDFYSLRDPGLEFAGYDNDVDAIVAAAQSSAHVADLLSLQVGERTEVDDVEPQD